ncbi:hypothetical protein DYB30_002568 [Aphanomyces astaci]|uniref:Uncharacterized protein n=1 Tax=Aphanomyces astaci TaxID=112090 RepID=A0A397CTY5_APHAT|nr:hypothetical protein DYB30_002568 [Aphanomyces astaci]
MNTSHGSLMHRLALYTHAVVRFALHIHEGGGCAVPICRSKPLPGLFSSVITVTDPSTFDPLYKDISAKLACAILEDVRVYRESKKINNQLHIITLYRDCHRVYVSCYDPVTSMLWKADIPEADMNILLAPNSLEVLQQKKPPRNPKELYKSVVGYCALSKPRGRDPSMQLELRPRAMRLCRLTRKIHGHFATITLAEVTMGHLQLDVHVHDSFSSKTISWTVHVNDDEFQKLKLNATDPVELAAYDSMDVQAVAKSSRSVRAICHVDLAVLPNEIYGINVYVYLPLMSHTHVIRLCDAEVQTMVTWPWPCVESAADRLQAIRAIFLLCTYDTTQHAVRLESAGCFVKYSTRVSPVVGEGGRNSPKPSTPLVVDNTPLNRPTTSDDLDLLANTVCMLDGEVGTKLCLLYDVVKTLHTGSFRCNGTLLMATLTMKAYLKPVILPNKPGLPDIHTSVDSFLLSMDIYHPEISQHSIVNVDGMHELREVTGPDEAHLIGSKTVPEWLNHVITTRLDRTVHPDGTFTATLVRSRLYSEYKATPINSNMDCNALHNNHLLIDNGTLWLPFSCTKFTLTLVVDKRGVKITSKAKQIRGHAVIFTAFDLTSPPSTTTDEAVDDRALHVHIRIDGYFAATSQNLSVWVRGATLMETIGSDVALLQCGHERALANHLIDFIDLEMMAGGDDAGGKPSIGRLFVKESVVSPPSPAVVPVILDESTGKRAATPATPPCLYKTFCAVAGEKVLVTVLDTSEATPALPLCVMLYQPSSCLTTQVDVRRNLLEQLVPLERTKWTTKADMQTALRQLLSYLSVTRVEGECGTTLAVAWNVPENEIHGAEV